MTGSELLQRLQTIRDLGSLVLRLLELHPLDVRARGGGPKPRRLFGPGVALDGFELRDGDPAGYWFQINGKTGRRSARATWPLDRADWPRLIHQHLTKERLGLRIAHREARGRIEWDDAYDGRVPILIIDGQEITWEDFGRMVMSFEGWHFLVKIHDKSEEC